MDHRKQTAPKPPQPVPVSVRKDREREERRLRILADRIRWHGARLGA